MSECEVVAAMHATLEGENGTRKLSRSFIAIGQLPYGYKAFSHWSECVMVDFSTSYLGIIYTFDSHHSMHRRKAFWIANSCDDVGLISNNPI